MVIGGVIALGAIVLLGLMALAMRETPVSGLQAYCDNNPAACVAEGAEDAPVTIVEVMDYSCGHCRNFILETAPLIDQQYVETGQVRLVSLPYALRAETIPAANAGMCAAEQDAYYPFTDAMFANFDEPDNLTRAGFVRAAEAAELDMEPFTQCVDEGRYVSTVQENIQRARAAGVTSTPNFFIDGRKLEGNQPFSVFQQRIESLLNS
jgi:protein-disulfide isomerase